MKKIMRVLLAGLLVMGLAACQEKRAAGFRRGPDR